MKWKVVLLIFAVFAVILFSGCPEEEITPYNLPKDQEGKSSQFVVARLVRCSQNELVFKIKNVGDHTIYWPYIFAGENDCSSMPTIYSAEDWAYDADFYERYLNKEYTVTCPDPEDADAFKHTFVDGVSYTIRMEAMTNTGSVTCDYYAG